MGPVTGIDDVEEGAVSLYPNPAHTILYVNGLKGNTKISILDVTGRLITEQITSKELNVSALANGTYFIQFTDKNTKVQKRFVKE